jgi:hypothetical protein
LTREQIELNRRALLSLVSLNTGDVNAICDMALRWLGVEGAEVVAYYRQVGCITPDSPTGPAEYDEEFELMMADEIDEQYIHLFYPLIAKPEAR